MRPIDADEALKALGEAPLVWDEYTDEYELGQRKQWEQDVEAIKALPTIEAEPVRRGWWLHTEDDIIISGQCSECGWVSAVGETDVAGMPYCPNCGARMEEQE